MTVGREIIDEYGWRNYGDAYADHEAVNHQGLEPFVSHYNNQYDVLLATLLHGLRAARPDWLAIGDDLARHVADIDLYHTADDRPAFNGGLFWHTDHYVPAGLATHRTYSRMNAGGKAYGGGPSNEHNYTSGLLLHHFLTGDPDSSDAVETLSNYVFAIDDGSLTPLGLIDPSPTGGASQTVSADYHKPGRGAGNSINALLDAYLLTRRRDCLRKAEELIERCAHPQDNIETLQLDQPEHRWSYLVFLQVLSRYLEQKVELGEFDYGFTYARATLLHYARWVHARETPYLDQLHKVLLPTETWPAHDVRKAHVLAAAARYCLSSTECDAFRMRAAEFARRALVDVNGFATARLMRPRIVLGLYFFAYVRHQRSTGDTPRPQTDFHEFGAPDDFQPQRLRWRTTLSKRLRVIRHDLIVRLAGRLPRWRR